jgi:RNA polymerase sigma-70 factor, ECF subfamily
VTFDDSQLMRRVQAGELACFDLLVDRYRPALVRVASGMLGDPVLAEDVVQETYLAVFAARHTFNPSLPFRTWLWTILLNQCRRHRARRMRHPQQLLRSALEGDANPADRDLSRHDPTTPETGLAAVLKREQSDQLQQLLTKLPETQADAIRLRFFAGLTYDEIAQSMGISLGGAKLRVRSGLSKLSRRLRGDEETCDEL